MPSAIIHWFEVHEALSSWAQFIGAMAALLLTYFTAFAPQWRRKKQLELSARRLLSNGEEVIESYYRVSDKFLPFALSLRVAALSMKNVADEIDRFPTFELDFQGPRSVARYLATTSMQLHGMTLYLESLAGDLDKRTGTLQDQVNIREFVGGRLQFIRDMLTGAELVRPVWPTEGVADEDA